MSHDSTPSRICVVCSDPFTGPANKKYCGRDCAAMASRERAGIPDRNLSAGTVGALHEMVVAVDLMRRGWHVFRALSPSCPCDLVAFTPDGAPVRIEVRTSHRNSMGGILRTRTPKDAGRQDMFADVMHDGVIHYDPPL